MTEASISLCMIVRDEEEVLERCLSTIADIVDEIIIVDTGSTDNTKEIARKFTDKIYDFEWIDDFSKARNFSFSKSTKEYIMWLDADDIVPDESRQQILELKNKLITHNMKSVLMEYQYAFDAEGNSTFAHRRERIVKRDCNFKWVGKVHEILDVSGTAHVTNIVIKHKRMKAHSDRNIKIYEKALKLGETLSIRDRFNYANECYDNQQYDKALKLYEEYLKEFEDSDLVDQRVYGYLKIVDCLIQLNEFDKAILNGLKSFQLDYPRAEVCCRLGYLYETKKEILKAINWYKIATAVDIPMHSTYIQQHCYTWLPHLQLFACYVSIGNFQEAKRHNDLAAKYIPNSAYVTNNEKVLEEMKLKYENGD
ncbi:glycosyltransferase [Chengkuizengella sp. SCS-71B]|uniref:tetratricopeptide repeat-containing glycosyltransferase family 2 protein n=1 Tax=Chengkuizengella sp. SCS-71B TaxID=3115290 RepID=UPI0032C24291